MLIENWKSALKMLSVQVQGTWAVVMTAWLAMSAQTQAQVLQAIGFKSGDDALALLNFFAQVSIGVSATTIAARLKKQSNVE